MVAEVRRSGAAACRTSAPPRRVRIVPTRRSIAARAENGMARLDRCGCHARDLLPSKTKAPVARGLRVRSGRVRLLRLDAPAVGVRPLPLVTEPARPDERRRRPRALVVGLVALAVVPRVTVRIRHRLARLVAGRSARSSGRRVQPVHWQPPQRGYGIDEYFTSCPLKLKLLWYAQYWRFGPPQEVALPPRGVVPVRAGRPRRPCCRRWRRRAG